jgi:hypothetical protein
MSTSSLCSRLSVVPGSLGDPERQHELERVIQQRQGAKTLIPPGRQLVLRIDGEHMSTRGQGIGEDLLLATGERALAVAAEVGGVRGDGSKQSFSAIGQIGWPATIERLGYYEDPPQTSECANHVGRREPVYNDTIAGSAFCETKPNSRGKTMVVDPVARRSATTSRVVARQLAFGRGMSDLIAFREGQGATALREIRMGRFDRDRGCRPRIFSRRIKTRGAEPAPTHAIQRQGVAPHRWNRRPTRIAVAV